MEPGFVPISREPIQCVAPGGMTPSVGAFGYALPMVVCQNDMATIEALEEMGVSWGDITGAIRAGLFLVGFAEEAGGAGFYRFLLLPEAVAAQFLLGDRVTLHYNKNSRLGNGRLVAVSRDAPRILSA